MMAHASEQDRTIKVRLQSLKKEFETAMERDY